MHRSKTASGLFLMVLAALAFGTSGAFVKPLFEAGWTPAAGVAARGLIGGILIMPIALIVLRGRWSALWHARLRVLGMGLVGVAGTQLAYFAAVERIPVSTAILIEYLAPVLLVAVSWAVTRRAPRAVVVIGSAIALGGLVLVVAPEGGGGLDALGLLFAGIACVGCAAYYVIAARPSDGLPPVALAAAGLLLGGIVSALIGLVGLVPFAAPTTEVELLGSPAPWWVPLLVVSMVGTGFAYVTSIVATARLGSRLASFAGLLEVVAAAGYAAILLGESLTVWQLVGGALILVGIAFVHGDRTPASAAAMPPVDDSPGVPVAASPRSGRPEER